jgi:uncharacterized protein with HEPN domain
MRADRERLLDILEAIELIEQYAIRGEEAFRSDQLIQNWMTSHIQTIGEAARSLSQETRHRATDIPWSLIIGMRHILVHHYFAIDLDKVWLVVHSDLPRLKPLIARLLETEDTESER